MDRLQAGYVGGGSGALGGPAASRADPRRRRPADRRFRTAASRKLVTNNTADFTDLDVPVVDWTADPAGG
jgi:hypothetical protein